MPGPSPERIGPHVRLHTVAVPVADLARSLEFYAAALGFTRVHEMTLPRGVRAGLVGPPDGTTILVLIESDPQQRMGKPTGVSFVTDDIEAGYRDWSSRGVPFDSPPRPGPFGVTYVSFRDPDGNGFQLVQADELTREIEAERRSRAEQLERERHAAREIAIATDVQAGLFPRRRPFLSTLDYAGVCLQARQVGGDYFDFLDFGVGQLGLVVGDVSGKGLGAALLMANLQAHVRSQYSLHSHDPAALMSVVNQLFQQSSHPASYATLFFGIYHDESRIFRFVNCGHPPAVLFRRNGDTELLEATGYVLGLFDEWTGSVGEAQIEDGDVLALYSDGVTETRSDDDAEFGLTRLVQALGSAQSETAQALLERVLVSVQGFNHGRQEDDITLVIAQCSRRTNEGNRPAASITE
jgi:serine phosphatase RsbU (regulator of sigma subunit)/catechol 2,3-dioxygenase-like lactoylglutathione lyase family enzyme